MTTHNKSRILQEVHSTAMGLSNSGLIGKRRMAEFDVLCDLEVKEISPTKIRRLRQKENLAIKNQVAPLSNCSAFLREKA